jgi:hypothetical protein
MQIKAGRGAGFRDFLCLPLAKENRGQPADSSSLHWSDKFKQKGQAA